MVIVGLIGVLSWELLLVLPIGYSIECCNVLQEIDIN
jgi:protoheme ferro-lyase